MNIEPTLISLCVLSKVNVNDKIYINKYGHIALHQDSKMTAIYRIIFGESREKSLVFINNLVNETINKIYQFHKEEEDVCKMYIKQLVESLNKSIMVG